MCSGSIRLDRRVDRCAGSSPVHQHRCRLSRWVREVRWFRWIRADRPQGGRGAGWGHSWLTVLPQFRDIESRPPPTPPRNDDAGRWNRDSDGWTTKSGSESHWHPLPVPPDRYLNRMGEVGGFQGCRAAVRGGIHGV